MCLFAGGDEGGLAEDSSEGGTNWGLTCAIAVAVFVGLLVCGGLATFAVGGLFTTRVGSSSSSRPVPQQLYLQEYALPHARSTPLGIVLGPDGAVWFTESDGHRIGRITAQGTISEFGLRAGNGKPMSLASGPDGNLWFTEGNAHIGRLTPKGTATEFALPYKVTLGGIAAGRDGNLWFTESGAADAIGRITPQGTITEYALPQAASQAAAITAGADGNLWFTEIAGNRVGRITPQGTITEYAIPTVASDPERITAGPDGAVWLTENAANKLARVTSDGHITEHTVGDSSGPLGQARDLSGIAAQRGGWLWVSAKDNTIVRLSTDGSVSAVMGLPTTNSQPGDLVVDANNTIWCVETGANAIARVQLVAG
jgi:streptogramin lyase